MPVTTTHHGPDGKPFRAGDLTTTMTVKRIRMVCARCGSEDVGREASAKWDTENQEWELGTLHDQGFCDSCNDDATLKEELMLEAVVPTPAPAPVAQYVPSDEDRAATQRHAIFGILVGHCGQSLTPDRIDEMRDEIVKEMREGSTAWAFAKGDAP